MYDTEIALDRNFMRRMIRAYEQDLLQLVNETPNHPWWRLGAGAFTDAGTTAPTNILPAQTIHHILIMYKQLKVDLTVSAEQLELLHFLLCNDRVRIMRDNPDSFNNPGSYAEQIEQLWALVTHTRDNNLTSSTEWED
jgi:hypothetical protein